VGCSITWKRFIVLSLLLLIVTASLQLPPFTGPRDENDTRPASRSVDITVTTMACDQAKRKLAAPEVTIDEHGVRIKRAVIRKSSSTSMACAAPDVPGAADLRPLAREGRARVRESHKAAQTSAASDRPIAKQRGARPRRRQLHAAAPSSHPALDRDQIA